MRILRRSYRILLVGTIFLRFIGFPVFNIATFTPGCLVLSLNKISPEDTEKDVSTCRKCTMLFYYYLPINLYHHIDLLTQLEHFASAQTDELMENKKAHLSHKTEYLVNRNKFSLFYNCLSARIYQAIILIFILQHLLSPRTLLVDKSIPVSPSLVLMRWR